MRIFGVAGWRNSGKTTLIRGVVAALVAQGLKVGTVKHTHHDIDPDPPHKDSALHRAAGASSVMLVGPKRAVLTQEYHGDPSPDLTQIRAAFQGHDLLIFEGFSGFAMPRLEAYDASKGRGLRCADDPELLAVAHAGIPAPDPKGRVQFDRNHIDDIARFVLQSGRAL